MYIVHWTGATLQTNRQESDITSTKLFQNYIWFGVVTIPSKIKYLISYFKSYPKLISHVILYKS